MALEWIRSHDPSLFEAICFISLERIFVNGNRPGTTFLLPTGDTRAKILANLSIDASEEENEVAAKQLAAMVIVDSIRSPEAFKTAALIPNCLKQNIAVDHTKCTRDKIVFVCGASAVLKYTSDDGRTIIYSLTGEIPVNGPAITSTGVTGRRIASAAPPSKPKGIWNNDSFEVTPAARAIRAKYTKEVESRYIAEQQQSDVDNVAARPIYTEHVIGLLDYIIENCSSQATGEILTAVLPYLSFESVDFYLFVDPYRTAGQYLIPTEIIKDFASSPVSATKSALLRVEQALESLSGASAIVNQRVNLAITIDETRDSLLSVKERRGLPSEIINLYALVANNKIADMSPVFEPTTLRTMKINPLYKLCIDEMRYVVYKLLDRLEKRKFDSSLYSQIRNIIRDYTEEYTLTRIINETGVKHSIGPQERINDIMTFINSKYFMFTPLTSSELKDFKTKIQVTLVPSAMGEAVWYPLDDRPYITDTKTQASTNYASESEKVYQLLSQMQAKNKLDGATKTAINKILDTSQEAV